MKAEEKRQKLIDDKHIKMEKGKIKNRKEKMK